MFARIQSIIDRYSKQTVINPFKNIQVEIVKNERKECKCKECGCGKKVINLKLRPETEQWLLDIAPKHFATEDSPTSYEEVKKQAEKYGIYHVFSGGSEDTIFTDRKFQYAYRAWHDSLHLANKLDFSKESELKVAKLQQLVAVHCGIDPRDAHLLRLDLEAHIEYHYAKGEHPVRQLELLNDCLIHGVDAVVNSDKIYH